MRAFRNSDEVGTSGVVGSEGHRSGAAWIQVIRGDPVGGIEATDARTPTKKGDRSGPEGMREERIMGVGRRDAQEDGQAGAPAEQGMDAVAAQKQSGMERGGMTGAGIGISAPPGFERRAVNRGAGTSRALAVSLPDSTHRDETLS